MLFIKGNKLSKGYDPVVIYTDGSADNINRKGGWAFVAHFSGRIVARYGFDNGTSNAMELRAMQEVLLYLRLTYHPLHIWTDSLYVIGCMNNSQKWRDDGWGESSGIEVKNLPAIKKLHHLVNRHASMHRLEVRWVKGHNKSLMNEVVDKLAGHARKAQINATKSVTGDLSSHSVRSLLALFI